MANNTEFAAWKAGFWQQHQRFLKALLPTESPHPLTQQLAELAQSDLKKALAVLQAVDLAMLKHLSTYVNEMHDLHQALHQVMAAGNRVFILGCGATGRLAVSLEKYFNDTYTKQTGQVIAIIGGGETALIHSIEKFEDQREYGIRQLLQAGFTQDDLLISASAGGESPFVLGALEYAAKHAKVTPWLICCNPREVLLERDANHPLTLPSVRFFSLNVGPMALTGSTRMQATTALMLAIGLALLNKAQSDIESQLAQFTSHVGETSLLALLPFIEQEALVYGAKDTMLYVTERSIALTVLTDTTERAPTFNLSAFDKVNTNKQASWVYMCLPEAQDAKVAWQQLLNREPRALNWNDIPFTRSEYLYGFDFSVAARHWRTVKQHELLIRDTGEAFSWQLDHLSAHFSHQNAPLLLKQLWLKLLLNNHSTLLMGRLGFYESNLMTSLSPSNYKLVDRAIRYVGYLWQQKTGQSLAYPILAETVFAEMQSLKSAESIVHKSLRSLALSQGEKT